MRHCTRSQIVTLILALMLPFCASAEERNAPAEAAKSAPAAAKTAASAAGPLSKTVVANVADERKTALTPAAAAAAATEPAARPALPASAAKPALIIEEKAVATAPVLYVRGKPKKPAPPRVAAAAKSAVKAPEPPAVAAPRELHWSYEGEKTGPRMWAKLAPEFAKCGSGERQSPIDIRDGMKVDLDPVVFEYRPGSFKVVDNGHAIQANVGGWNSMRVMGRRFKLVQFHFHRPSEEVVDGKQFEMVVHLVHKDSEGRLAVVAVLVDAGARQPAIQAVLNNLPLEKGEEVTAATPLDMNLMLPEKKTYFTYMGSLTTPPCTEDVLWIVMKQPLQASAEQLEIFSRLYPMNARPVQSAGNRMIKESN